MTIKRTIRDLHKRGWTYKKISSMMKISTSTLYNYRKDKIKNPKKINKWFKTTYKPKKRYETYFGERTGYDFKKKTYIRTKGVIPLNKNNYIDFELQIYNDLTEQYETRWYRHGMSGRADTDLNTEIRRVIKKIIDEYEDKSYHVTLLSIDYSETRVYKYENNKHFYNVQKQIGEFNVKR